MARAGLAPTGVVRSSHPSVAPQGDTVFISVAWFSGTDLYLQLDFGDSSPLHTWDWQTAGHTDSYGSMTIYIEHTYEQIQNYTVTLEIWNEVERVQLQNIQYVEPVLEDYIIFDTSESGAPVPLNVEYSVINTDLTLTIRIGMNCTFQYGDETEESFTFWLQDIASVDHLFDLDMSQASTSLFCHNHVSNITYESLIILQEAIYGLEIISNQVAFAVNETAIFTVTMNTGSHVTMNIDFGDGGPNELFTNPNIYSSSFVWNVTHVYASPENYTIEVTASNNHFYNNTIISVPVIIQIPVPTFTVTSSDHNVKTPDGYVSFELALSNNTHPSDVFCSWSLYHRVTEVVYSPSLTTGVSVTHNFNYARSQVGEAIIVNITCFNLVSEESNAKAIAVYEEIQNLYVYGSRAAVPLGEMFDLIIVLLNGSSVEFIVYWEENTTVPLAHPALFAMELDTVLSHNYSTVGNHSVNVTAHNPVSSMEASLFAIVQHPVANLHVDFPESVLWPPGLVNYSLSISGVELQNIHCNWHYYDNLVEYRYYENIQLNMTYQHYYEFGQEAIGNQSVNVNCSNMATWQMINTTISVIFDEVLLDHLDGGHPVWRTNTSMITLRVRRFGTHSCFKFSMGDGIRYMYGMPWCSEHAVTEGLQLIAIDFGTMTIVVNHTYEHFDRFNVTVHAFNHVSSDTRSVITVVKEWYCYRPNITFDDNITDSANPLQFMRSEDFFTRPSSLEIDCMKSYNQSSTVWHIRNGGTLVDTQENVIALHHPARYLSYGVYTFEFIVEMLGFEQYFDSKAIYIEIIPTTLSVSINDTSNFTLNFNDHLTLNALDFSFDPDVEPTDDQGLQFEWYCRQLVEEYNRDASGDIADAGPANPDIIREELFTGCFGGGPGKLSETSGVLRVSTGDMFPGKEYEFAVRIFKGMRESFIEINMMLLAAAAPVAGIVASKLNLGCRENCEWKRRLSSHMILDTMCDANCETKFGGLHYSWSLRHEQQEGLTNIWIDYTNLNEISLTGNDSATLYVLPWTLNGGLNHSLLVNMWTPGSFHTVLDYRFLSNLPPYGGNCSANPPEGFGGNTLFDLSCFGWREWNTDQQNLKYEYRVRAVDSERAYLFYYGNSSSSGASILPLGSLMYDFLNEIEFYIVDSIGDYFIFRRNLTVWPPPQSHIEIADQQLQFLNDENSNISKQIAEGDYQGMLGTIFSYTSLINIPASYNTISNSTDPHEEVVSLRKTLRSHYMHMAATVPVNNSDSLDQTNSVVTSLLLSPEELHTNALETAVSTVDNLVIVYDNIAADLIKIKKDNTAKDLLGSSARVMYGGSFIHRSVSFNNSNAEQNETNQVSTILKNGNIVMDDIMESILGHSTFGDPQTNLEVEDVSVYVGKMLADSVENQTIQTNQGSVKMQSLSLHSSNNPSICIEQKVLFTGFNPYVYSNSSDSVNSNVLQFTLQECVDATENLNITSRRRRKRSSDNLVDESSFDVTLAVESGDAVLVNESDTGGMLFHTMNLTQPYKTVVIAVYPYINESLNVYSKFGENPSVDNFEFLVQMPIENSNSSDEQAEDSYELSHVFSISHENVSEANASSLHIGIERAGCIQDHICENTGFIVYSYKLSQISCRQWDEVNEVWNTDHCEVTTQSTTQTATFKSNLFGSMGANVIVAPNTIDFSSVFNNLDQKLIDNAAVVGTVIGVIILFIPFAVLCRKLDKRDKAKWAVLPLVDNFANDQHRYAVHVYTGWKTNAETDSAISFIIAGTESDTGVRKLQDGNRKNFQRGDVNSFLLLNPETLGMPCVIKIWHDNSGNGNKAGWFLSKIVVADLQTKQWYLFMCEEWLSAGNGDGKIERLLHLSSKDDISKNGSLLKDNVYKSLFDDHLWLSLGFRKSRNCFTRLQRLCACLAILFLTMISNAMFFGTGDSETDKVAFQIGPVSMTIQQLYTSIISSFVIVPPIVLITTFFAKSGQTGYEENTSEDMMNGKDHPPDDKRCMKYYCLLTLAYVLVALSVTTGAFFTILYAFEWGKEKSERWLVTFILSFVESVLLVQPLKVIGVSLLLTFLFKNDRDVSTLEAEIGTMAAKDESAIPVQLGGASLTVKIGVKDIEEARKRTRLSNKSRILMSEVLWQLIFLILILWVVVGPRDSNAFYQNQDLKNVFLDGTELTEKSETWSWIEDVLVPNLYYNGQYNEQTLSADEEKFIRNGYAIRLGQPRLRQLRVVLDPCHIAKPTKKVTSRCIHKYSLLKEDRKSYALGWTALSSNTTSSASEDRLEKAYQYQSDVKLETISFWGDFYHYSGGGYVANLGKIENEATVLVDFLKGNDWINQYTRALFIEFNVWNANTNLFNMIMIVFEYHETGFITCSYSIDVIELYRYSGAGGLLSLFSEILLTIFVIVKTILVIKNIAKSNGEYFRSVWSVATIIVLFAIYIAFGFYIWRSILTANTVENVMNNRDKSISFQYLSIANTVFVTCMSIAAFIVQLGLLHILRYNRTITLLTHTILKSADQLLAFGLFLLAFILAFASLTHCLFGEQLYEFRSVWSTFGRLAIRYMFLDYELINEAAGTVGVVIMLIYCLSVLVILLNFIITFINDALTDLANDSSILPKDYEVVDYLVSMIFGKLFTSHDDKNGNEREDKHSCESVVDIDLRKRVDTLSRITDEMMPSKATMAVVNLLHDFEQWQESRENTHNAAHCFPEPYVDIDMQTLDREIEDVVKFAILRQLTGQMVNDIKKSTK